MTDRAEEIARDLVASVASALADANYAAAIEEIAAALREYKASPRS